MTLNAFITSVRSEVLSKEKDSVGMSKIVRASQRKYKTCCSAPDNVQVRFGASIMHTDKSRMYSLNLLAVITPEHPSFRPWLQKWARRYSEPIYTLTLYPADLQILPCGYALETEIEAVAVALETRITGRVRQFEQYLHTVDRISRQYGLRCQDASDFFHSVNEMSKLYQYGTDFLLDPHTRASLFQK